MKKPSSPSSSTTRKGARSRGRRGEQGGSVPAWRVLVRIHGLVRRISEQHFLEYGLSSSQWGILRSLHRLEERGLPEPKVNELGKELLVQPPSLSATLDRMARMGMIRRMTDSTDRRSRRVSMTRKGREILLNALPSHQRWVDQVLSGINKSELNILKTTLHRLAEHLEHIAEHPHGDYDMNGSGRRERGGS